MWSKISSALKPRDGNDGDTDHSDAQSSPRPPPPDPFCVNATTYYTHQVPPSPPQGGHSRTASREEDIIWSLRTQLALQQELCTQFEIDLRARDELVEALTIRLAASEKENDKRKNVVRSWKKKAADLEKMCRHLEDEVDHSRQETMERSIMDEASGAALRQLHQQIAQLERERNDVEAERNSLAQMVENAEAEIVKLEEGVWEANEEEAYRLRDQISQLEQEKRDVEDERDTLARALQAAKAEIAKLRGEFSVADEASAKALRQLHSQISELEEQKNSLLRERDASTRAREKADTEAIELQEQLTATEETNREVLCKLRSQISQLEREMSDVQAERDNFSSEISRLRTHIQQLQKDSAVKEVTIVQLNKQRDRDKQDIDGLNIALESKQQELELIKRKHSARGAVGPAPGRTRVASSTSGKLVGNAGQPTKISRTSFSGAETPPISHRVPSALGRAANTAPPVTNALRRVSSSSVEIKPKLSIRRVSITSTPSESDEKENTSTPVPLNNPRRTMVPA